MKCHQSSFKQLEVWQAAMELAETCYRATAAFPTREWYGLASQIRRAAVSIPSNVAEGHSRRSRAAYLYHVSVALGSHAELEAQVALGRRLSLFSARDADALDASAPDRSAAERASSRDVGPLSRVPSTEYRLRCPPLIY
jgi:four helix bundle protein